MVKVSKDLDIPMPNEMHYTDDKDESKLLEIISELKHIYWTIPSKEKNFSQSMAIVIHKLQDNRDVYEKVIESENIISDDDIKNIANNKNKEDK